MFRRLSILSFRHRMNRAFYCCPVVLPSDFGCYQDNLTSIWITRHGLVDQRQWRRDAKRRQHARTSCGSDGRCTRTVRARDQGCDVWSFGGKTSRCHAGAWLSAASAEEHIWKHRRPVPPGVPPTPRVVSPRWWFMFVCFGMKCMKANENRWNIYEHAWNYMQDLSTSMKFNNKSIRTNANIWKPCKSAKCLRPSMKFHEPSIIM